MRNRRVLIFLGFCLTVFFVLVFLKDRIVYRFIKKNIEHVLPGSVFYADGVKLQPGKLVIKSFGLKNGPQAASLAITGGTLEIKFSTWGVFFDSVLSCKEGRIALESLSYQGVKVQGFDFSFYHPAGINYLDSNLKIHRLSYEDIEARGFNSRLKIRPGSVEAEVLELLIWRGKITGLVQLHFSPASVRWDLKSRIEHIEFNDIVRALRLEKRFTLSGLFDGQLQGEVVDGQLSDISGLLQSEGGGQLLITDNSLNSQELMKFKGSNILVENLGNYHYDIGSIIVENQNQAIRMDIRLEGKTGSRNFEIFWHRVVDQKAR